MSAWASKRKFTYLALFFIFCILAIGVPVFVLVNKPPSCTDGKQNGQESGIDCGGICKQLCRADALPPTVLWQRAFKVAPGIYNVVAYIENPNIDWAVKSARYIFKVYDEKGVVIVERKGRAAILPHQTFPIFEQSIQTGLRIPSRILFEYPDEFDWVIQKDVNSDVRVVTIALSRETTTPHIEAFIENKSAHQYSNTEVVAVVFDSEGNAMATSRTFVDFLDKESKVPIVFTWPSPFPDSVSKIDIIPKIAGF